MPVTSTSVPAWSLSANVATAADGGRIDLDAPARGLVLPGGDSLLGVDLRTACRATERWLRGDDLIAIYEPVDARRLRTTALWRPCHGMTGATLVAWELTLSAQTGLVQSDAMLPVICDVSCGDVRWSAGPADAADWRAWRHEDDLPHDATSLLLRRPGRNAAETILVAVHPADARRIDLRRTADRMRVESWLFSTAIEKGVLLRGRVLAAIGPAGSDTAWATAAVTAFAASPPPLSA